jgi:hypothetical protein
VWLLPLPLPKELPSWLLAWFLLVHPAWLSSSAPNTNKPGLLAPALFCLLLLLSWLEGSAGHSSVVKRSFCTAGRAAGGSWKLSK